MTGQVSVAQVKAQAAIIKPPNTSATEIEDTEEIKVSLSWEEIIDITSDSEDDLEIIRPPITITAKRPREDFTEDSIVTPAAPLKRPCRSTETPARRDTPSRFPPKAPSNGSLTTSYQQKILEHLEKKDEADMKVKLDMLAEMRLGNQILIRLCSERSAARNNTQI